MSRVRTLSAPVAAAALAFAVGAAVAGEFEFTGSLVGEVRVFVQKPKFPGQFSHFQPSLAITPELSYDSDDRRHQRLAPVPRPGTAAG